MKDYSAALRPDELLNLANAQVWCVNWVRARFDKVHTRHNTLEEARAAVAALCIPPHGRQAAIYAETYAPGVLSSSGARGTFVPDNYPAAYPGAVPGVGDGKLLDCPAGCLSRLHGHLPPPAS